METAFDTRTSINHVPSTAPAEQITTNYVTQCGLNALACLRYTWDKILKFTPVFGEAAIVACDWTFFIGEEDPHTPPKLALWSYTALTVIGCLYIPYYGDAIIKRAADAYFALKHRDWKIITYSMLHQVKPILGLGLTVMGTVAAVMEDEHDPRQALKIYSRLKPIADTGLAIGYAMTLTNIAVFWLTKRALVKRCSDSEVAQIVRSIAQNRAMIEESMPLLAEAAPNAISYAPAVRASIVKDTIRLIKQQESSLQTSSDEEVKNIVISSVDAELKLNSGFNLALITAGDIASAYGVSKMESKRQAIAFVIESSAYLLKYSIEKGVEAWNRSVYRGLFSREAERDVESVP